MGFCLSSAGILLGGVTYLCAAKSPSNVALVLEVMMVFGAIVLFIAGPAWMVLSSPAIFALIYHKFGFQVLLLALVMCAIMCSVADVLIWIYSYRHHEAQIHAMVGLMIATGVLWSAVYQLIRSNGIRRLTDTRESVPPDIAENEQ